jgi:hypothetical protein
MMVLACMPVASCADLNLLLAGVTPSVTLSLIINADIDAQTIWKQPEFESESAVISVPTPHDRHGLLP